MNEDKEIRFIARRYRRGRFSTNEAWRRLGIAPAARWTRSRIAAVAAGIIFLSATAAIVYRQQASNENVPVETIQPREASPLLVVKVIDFENTPLPMVIDRIAEVYGVEVTNIPANADDYRLSLHYEGTPIDLVETINEILETNMVVTQK